MTSGNGAGKRAADLLVDCLAAQGTDRIFCVPGESYLALLDALQDSHAVDLVTWRWPTPRSPAGPAWRS